MDGARATGPGGEMQLVADECRRLVDRLTGVSITWFQARVAGREISRARRLRELVLTLAWLGHEAGNGAPAGAVPGDVGVHALADQVTVLVHDIRLAPRSSAVAGVAAHAVRACYDDLWSPLTP